MITITYRYHFRPDEQNRDQSLPFEGQIVTTDVGIYDQKVFTENSTTLVRENKN